MIVDWLYPAMFMSTVFASHAFDGAIMLTASHLPFNRNGMKFFTRAGGLDKKDISTILERAEKKGLVESQPLLRTEATELMPDYSAHLLSIIRTGTEWKSPWMDCILLWMLAMGRVVFLLNRFFNHWEQIQPAVSFGAGWDVPESYSESRRCNAMSAMVEAVLQQKADFGISLIRTWIEGCGR